MPGKRRHELIHEVADEAREFDARMDVEFGVDVLEVRFDRVDADAEFARDVGIPFAVRDQARDLGLARG